MAESPNYPPTNDRDITMGQFMDAWSQLENKLFLLFWILSGTNSYIAKAIFSTGIQSKNLTELLITIAPYRLTNSEQKTLKSLCDRFRGAAKKRNKIVHGAWYLETKAGNSQWVRIYSPISYKSRADIHNPQKQQIRSTYRFTIHQLAEAVKQIETLYKDFHNLLTPLMGRLRFEEE